MSSSSVFKESENGHYTYSRKQKSLGLLCSNFLSLYNRDDVESIGLDEATSRLGVERRRIYDIVNVLESVGVLARKAKNQYSWKGFAAIPKFLEDLKEDALRENSGDTYINPYQYAKGLDDDEEENLSDQNCKSSQEKSSQSSGTLKPSLSSSNIKPENRREKSLGLLTQNFVKLFLVTNADVITLDEASKLLLGDGHNSWQMRTKVRRLYDIANVLSSMNLIEKTQQKDSRKPAFRWLGVNGKSKNCVASPNKKETKKREFGTEITNIGFRKNEAISLVDEKPNKMKRKCEDSTGNSLDQMWQQEPQKCSKGYTFGPFCPINTSKERDRERVVKRAQDWEALTSFHPQYRNQALMDLFSHYTEAWKSWYMEMAQGNNQSQNIIHQTS